MTINYVTDVGKPREVGHGVYVRLPGTAEIRNVELDGRLYDVDMELDMTPDGVRPVVVMVRSQADRLPVTGGTLRALRVWELARLALLSGVYRGHHDRDEDGESTLKMQRGFPSAPRIADLRRQGPTDETLEWVAYFYNLAGVLGLPPAKQVEINLEVPRTTATKWIRRARNKGLLGDPVRLTAPDPDSADG